MTLERAPDSGAPRRAPFTTAFTGYSKRLPDAWPKCAQITAAGSTPQPFLSYRCKTGLDLIKIIIKHTNLIANTK